MRQLATNAFFLHSLGKNDKTAVPALVDAVGDPDENVRLMAIGALERIGLAHQSVLKALERAKKDPKQSVRQAASGALRTLLAQPRPES